uniref:Uncharacterized protein n=1 Tax=Ditylenchus dipsaci TaxID=166011 RepID=A0A915E2H5_9BILA
MFFLQDLSRRRSFTIMAGGTCHSDVISEDCPLGKNMIVLEHSVIAYDSAYSEPKHYLYTYDLALIMLTKPITTSSTLNYICISKRRLESFTSDTSTSMQMKTSKILLNSVSP